MKKELIKSLILLIEDKIKSVPFGHFKITSTFAQLILNTFEITFELNSDKFFLKQIYRHINDVDHVELYFNKNKEVVSFYYMNLYRDVDIDGRFNEEAFLFTDFQFNEVSNDVIYDVICNDILKVIINEI